MAMGRAMDDVIIAAALGTALLVKQVQLVKLLKHQSLLVVLV
jgi:hypothetical protein